MCKLNWCHCVPGTWGIDCSLGTPRAAEARVAAHQQSEMLGADARTAPGGCVGWPEAMLGTPAPQLPPAAKSLRVYVYDLPPQYNV